MTHLIDHNFELHARRVPEQTPGMQVLYQPGLTYVDSGLSCDTFNILHITDGAKVTEAILGEAINYYQDRGLEFCIWVSRENLSPRVVSVLQERNLSRQNEEVGMVLDLKDYEARLNPNHNNVSVIEQPGLISDYARVLAHNWVPPDQNVLHYYKQTASAFLDPENEIRLLVYYHNGIPVSTLELFPTAPSTIGIYGFATLQEFRGQGIGSALFTFALNYALTAGYPKVILQASEDGLGIYTRYGFKPITTYYEYA